MPHKRVTKRCSLEFIPLAKNSTSKLAKDYKNVHQWHIYHEGNTRVCHELHEWARMKHRYPLLH